MRKKPPRGSVRARRGFSCACGECARCRDSQSAGGVGQKACSSFTIGYTCRGQAQPAPPKKVSQGRVTLGEVKSWRWPASGPVTRGYSGSVHKGIDIGGSRGDPVVAVAPGKVVYAGTGIVGFGELLIVKHNEQYLSAYGHNDRLLAAEGDMVSAGQTIAEKGSSGD